MDKERLKLIVRNLELLVDGLKTEVYSDPASYTPQENFDDPANYYQTDYDEVFSDDDGYPDWSGKKVYEIASQNDEATTSLYRRQDYWDEKTTARSWERIGSIGEKSIKRI